MVLEWIGIGAATFVGGWALWRVKRSTTRADERLNTFVSMPICEAKMEAGEQRFTMTENRLDRLDGRIEHVRSLSEQILLEVRKINGGDGS